MRFIQQICRKKIYIVFCKHRGGCSWEANFVVKALDLYSRFCRKNIYIGFVNTVEGVAARSSADCRKNIYIGFVNTGVVQLGGRFSRKSMGFR
jgi:hypothetical protein